MISAQSKSSDTPFLFGAPAITYTNYTNYNVPGGLLQMVKCIEESLVQNGGVLHLREKVLSLDKNDDFYEVRTSKNVSYSAPVVISNIPVWNMPDITQGKMSKYFSKESSKYTHAWGAFTMGVVTDDVYPDDLTLHHQLHFNEDEKIPGIASDSVFVSFSGKNDLKRAPAGDRVLNISTHTDPDNWFDLNGSYDPLKRMVQNRILEHLEKTLPGFSDAKRKLVFSSTPVTWNNWVYRKKGRVGGIPQSMNRSLLDWTPNNTPFKGLYLCGDTVFPGQGIPGVTLSGINVYYRVKNNFKKLTIH
jgi:phytoene dehydrogenase-like protein